MPSAPLSLITEITHRCPLHCVYCSNPLEMMARNRELPTDVWMRVFEEAAGLGVLQLHLTGGEPLARPDLVELVAAGCRSKLYVNVITSGIGLDEQRLRRLVDAGLDHIQLSFQDSDAEPADRIAGARAHARKLEIARLIQSQRVAFTVNMVVHRQNLDRLEHMISLAEELGAGRIEIANVQYYGWAMPNREALLPTRAQLDRSVAVVAEARKRLEGRMRIDFVVPDYYARYPKRCTGGWGRSVLLIDPAGKALPCHAAGVIPGLQFDNVCDHDVRWIWEQSPAFQKYRGTEWMPEPCQSCDRRDQDLGGCRCQAFLLTGNADATDPICSLAPDHGLVTDILEKANAASNGNTNWVYRVDPAVV